MNFEISITPANFSGLNPGAGHGGFSFTNEGGIAQIDSTGKITWSGNVGLGQVGRSHFSSGKDTLDAIANIISGRTDNSPPASPPDPPDEGGDPGDGISTW